MATDREVERGSWFAREKSIFSFGQVEIRVGNNLNSEIELGERTQLQIQIRDGDMAVSAHSSGLGRPTPPPKPTLSFSDSFLKFMGRRNIMAS